MSDQKPESACPAFLLAAAARLVQEAAEAVGEPGAFLVKERTERGTRLSLHVQGVEVAAGEG